MTREVRNVVKVLVVGRGQPTPRQISLLAKALNVQPDEIELIGNVEQLTSVQQLQQYPADAIFSFVLHPTVISVLQQYHKQTGIPYFAVQTEAVTTTEVSSKEEAEELARKHNADIVNLKVLPDGKISARLLRTKALLKNPRIRIEAEEVIE